MNISLKISFEERLCIEYNDGATKKTVFVRGHFRVNNGKKVYVKAHYRKR